MEISEFIMKMVTIGALTIGILGMIMQSAAFEGNVIINDKERVSIDFLQMTTFAPCLVEEIGGEAREGLFLAEKLNSITEDTFCISPPGKYQVTVKDDKNIWTIGDDFIGGHIKRAPVAIKYEDETLPGELVVKTE